jgi:hypothetical protein
MAMHGLSFGLLVDTGHDAPVAGAVPRPRAAGPGPLARGLRRLGANLLASIRRVDPAALLADPPPSDRK